MRQLAQRFIIAAAALLLTSCLWGPGKFASDLTVKRDGTFVLDYRGEIVIQLPPDGDMKTEPWTDSLAHCSNSEGKDRPCTKAEIAQQKTDYANSASAKRKENEDMAKAFGLPGLDEDSNRAFAAKLMKYAGWRSVTYRGKGVFDVDYHMQGNARQDFIFPALPDNNLIIPFVALRRRTDGSVLVTAPAFTGGSGPIAARAGAAAAAKMSEQGTVSHAQGRFTVITDGEILTNNSEDGASPHAAGRQLHWDVGPDTSKIPETLIRL
jgi:hypothetical protein